MIIWFLFFLVTYFGIYMYSKATNIKSKYVWFFAILLIMIYYAAFRDGLGVDYTTYKSYCERDVLRFGGWLMIEPLAVVLQTFCFNTQFSAVIFFLVTSTIMYTCYMMVYKDLDNSYLALFTFVTYTNLYLMSFNLVRQFVAASLILVGAYYFIIKRRSPFFFLLVFVAFLFHKSAALFLFLFFLKKNDYKPILWTVLILASMIVDVQPLFKIPIIRDLLIASDYLTYLNHDILAYSKISLLNIYMLAICLLFIWNKSKILASKHRELCIFSLKLSIISIIFGNLSSGTLPFAYRFAIFCSAFLPILFSLMPIILGKQLSKLLIYIPLTILMWNLLIHHSNDRVYCPERILPIESIFDKYYRPYENPNMFF